MALQVEDVVAGFPQMKFFGWRQRLHEGRPSTSSKTALVFLLTAVAGKYDVLAMIAAKCCGEVQNTAFIVARNKCVLTSLAQYMLLTERHAVVSVMH